MVATEDSANAHLLRGKVGQLRSDDDGNVEIVVDFKASRGVPVETSSTFRSRILHQIGQRVAHRVRSIGTRTKANPQMSVSWEKENISASALATKVNRSPYDEGSILEEREGPPMNEDELCETFSTVSSDLSSSSNQQRQRKLVNHWKHCMRLSVRKLLRKEIDDDIKGNPPKYQEFGLHLYPQDTIFDVSKERKRSAFNLFVPTLTTPTQSHDAASDAGQYDNAYDFPLKSRDEIAVEEAMRRRRQDKNDGNELKFPFLSPRRSNLFVSFDDEMAQIIFHSASSETDDYQAVEVHSVESDIDVVSQDDGSCAVENNPTSSNNPVDCPFSHPSLVRQQPTLGGYQATPHPRKGAPVRPETFSSRPRTDHHEVKVAKGADAPSSETTVVTDAQSPGTIETRGVDEPWDTERADFKESHLLMTDEILKTRQLYSPALPEIPLPKYIVDDYPFDEDSHRDDDYAIHGVRRRLEPRGRMDMDGEMLKNLPRAGYRGGAVADNKVKCGCIKCAAKSIYQDLMNCNLAP